MKKRLFNLTSILLVVPFLYACPSKIQNDNSIKDISYSFNDGKVSVSFKSDYFKSFILYDEENNQIASLDEPTFVTEEYAKSFLIVPLKEGQPQDEYKIKIPSYLDGSFSSENVRIFKSDDNHQEIQNFIDTEYNYLRSHEFDSQRLAMLFLPGDYSDITLKLGYYTSVHGLGSSPDDVIFKALEVANHPNTGNALINFWRSVENVSFNEDSMWAVSQATSIRRCHFKSNLVLSDSSFGNGWSSGGFIANSKIDGVINPGSQQQFLMRNDEFDSWTHSNMNMVFEGCVGEMPQDSWVNSKTTILENTLDVYEKPFLVFDENNGLGIINTDKKHTDKGYDWDYDASSFISFNGINVVNEKMPLDKIKELYKSSIHMIFTPGNYVFDETFNFDRDLSLIMGLGYATLVGNNKDAIVRISADGSRLYSLLFETKTDIQNYLIVEKNEGLYPILLSDVFFRVGGNTTNNVSVDTCLVINDDFMIGDNFWIWRADHGNNIGFNKNYAKTGCVINAQHVTVHALMVEHFFEYQTIWSGEYGNAILYQSETPYDAPNQSYWMRNEEGVYGEAIFGYPSYKVSNNVKNHNAFGVGVYFVNTTSATEKCYTAVEVPTNEGISFLHTSARYFGGPGGFLYCINNHKGYLDGANMHIELFDKSTFANLD